MAGLRSVECKAFPSKPWRALCEELRFTSLFRDGVPTNGSPKLGKIGAVEPLE